MDRFYYLFKRIMLVFFVCAMLLLSVCSQGCTNTQKITNDKELKSVTLVLDYTPNTNHLGIYVAKALGYFESRGLDVSIEQPPDTGADGLVATGKAQFGISFQDWMATYLGSDEKLPVTAIATIVQHNTSSILSLKESGIVASKDITNKTYGTMDVDIEQAILKTLVNEDGGDWSRVGIVSNNSVDEFQGLSSKMYDCVWSYDAWGVLMCEKKGMEVNAINIASLNNVFDYYTPVIIANNDYIMNNESDVQSFIDAVREGYVFASQNPSKAAQILCDADQSLDFDFVKDSANVLAKEFVSDAKQWGVFDEQRWSRFYEWVNSNNLTSKKIDVKSGFTNKFVENLH